MNFSDCFGLRSLSERNIVIIILLSISHANLDNTVECIVTDRLFYFVQSIKLDKILFDKIIPNNDIGQKCLLI